MTISSSLNAGVTGLNVNASKLATISDNIANSNTSGYKRATADFQSLVMDQGSGSYSAGGVRVTTGRQVDQQGSLLTTNNATDLSIRGRGMIPVTPVSALNGSKGAFPLQMTTTGSFRADDEGILRTKGGHALLGWPADKDGTIPSSPRDTVSDLEPVRVEASRLEGNPTTRISLGVNLPATDTAAGASGTARELPLQYFGNLGEALNLDISFTPDVSGPGASNSWRMEITDPAQPVGSRVIGAFDIVFDATRDDGGTIDRVTPVGPTDSYDPDTGLITVATPSGDLAIDIGTKNDRQGLSQISNTFAPLSVEKDGSPAGNLTSVEVDPNGKLRAIYDTGFTRVIYQIPVVDVPNPNGLRSLSSQTYEVSGESGAFYLWDAGDGPAGDMLGYSREESATDVAAELTQLIQTQRAYSSNAKVIQTVDEMLQETTNIKR
jgi:flagellar hook protein FlgE